jgi:hypothetical protein
MVNLDFFSGPFFRRGGVLAACLLCIGVFGAMVLAAQDRPGLFFREDWKETPAATPVTQDHVANANLLLKRYGPGKEGLKKSHHEKPADDPFYIWTGTCAANCAIALQHKSLQVDLTGQAKIRWRTKQTGFRHLRLILKLADGTWLVSDRCEGPTLDWRESEINIQDVHWRKLKIETIQEEAWVERPDLSRVEQVGWTDLMTGGGTPASSRVDWLEVYGKPVEPR